MNSRNVAPVMMAPTRIFPPNITYRLNLKNRSTLPPSGNYCAAAIAAFSLSM